MNENQRWYYAVDDQTHGPLEMVELERLIEDGVVLPFTWVVAEGTEDWSAAKDSVFAGRFDLPTQNPLAPPSEVDAAALSAVGSSPEPQLVNLDDSALASQKFVGGLISVSTLLRRRWILLALGILVLGSV